jgi:hypothetical protein
MQGFGVAKRDTGCARVAGEARKAGLPGFGIFIT